MKILIAGMPGMGKTTMGDCFRDARGFHHVDMETGENQSDAWNDPDKFISKVVAMPGDVVVTWGFVPDKKFINVIDQLKQNGFKLIWLDGNRDFALTAFIERNKKQGEEFLQRSLDNWKVQMSRIDASDALIRLAPKKLDTFNNDGTFKQPAEIAEEILFP